MPASQYVGTASGTLAFDLVFDSNYPDDGPPPENNGLDEADVRRYIQPIQAMLTTRTAGESASTTKPPPKSAVPLVRFRWGTFSVVGVVTTLNLDYELFSEDGVPLRAKAAVTMKEIDVSLLSNLTGPGANTGAAATDPAGLAPGPSGAVAPGAGGARRPTGPPARPGPGRPGRDGPRRRVGGRDALPGRPGSRGLEGPAPARRRPAEPGRRSPGGAARRTVGAGPAGGRRHRNHPVGRCRRPEPEPRGGGGAAAAHRSRRRAGGDPGRAEGDRQLRRDDRACRFSAAWAHRPQPRHRP